MIDLTKHMKCKRCGEYKASEKYQRFNSVEKGTVYRDILTGEFLSIDDYIGKIDRFNMICANCNNQGEESEAFERDKYYLDGTNEDGFGLCNRHYFICDCGAVHKENMGPLTIKDKKNQIFVCKECDKEFSRDVLNSRTREKL